MTRNKPITLRGIVLPINGLEEHLYLEDTAILENGSLLESVHLYHYADKCNRKALVEKVSEKLLAASEKRFFSLDNFLEFIGCGINMFSPIVDPNADPRTKRQMRIAANIGGLGGMAVGGIAGHLTGYGILKGTALGVTTGYAVGYAAIPIIGIGILATALPGAMYHATRYLSSWKKGHNIWEIANKIRFEGIPISIEVFPGFKSENPTDYVNGSDFKNPERCEIEALVYRAFRSILNDPKLCRKMPYNLHRYYFQKAEMPIKKVSSLPIAPPGKEPKYSPQTLPPSPLKSSNVKNFAVACPDTAVHENKFGGGR